MWMIGRDTERVTVAFVADAPSKADVLVVFGITGDLAKVMTFRSLYRLEQRGLLDCPIVGVAVDDTVFERLAKRFSYVQGDFGDDATYGRVGEAIGDAKTPVFYLEIPP